METETNAIIGASPGVIIGILCYFAGIMLIGFLLRHRNKSAEDFLVGGRSFGLFFNTGTLISCFLGGGIVISMAGTFYTYGMWNSGAGYGVLLGLGTIPCLLLAGFFYMRKLWQCKLLSLGDFYYQRFGYKAGLIATILMALTFTIWIAVQVLSFAKVGQTLVGFSLPVWIGLAMVVICTYTILGGLWAVCLTDVIQVIIVLISLLILTPVAINYVGGWDTFYANIPEGKMDFIPDTMSIHGWLPWVAALCTYGLGSIASPDLMQRAFSAKSGRVASHSAILSAIFLFLLTFVTITLILATMQMIDTGNLDRTMIDKDPELLIPLVFGQLMPGPMMVLFLGALLAAVMSAAATANIALAGIISKNIVQDLFLPNLSSRNLMQLTRVIILGIGIVAAIIALGLPSAFLLAALGFDLILSCLFIPLTLGLFWKKANGYGAVAGMIAGAVFRIGLAGGVQGFSLEAIASPSAIWYYFTLGGPLVSLAAMVIVSLATQKIDKPLEIFMEEDNS